MALGIAAGLRAPALARLAAARPLSAASLSFCACFFRKQASGRVLRSSLWRSERSRMVAARGAIREALRS
eukprot:8069503-Pyramimonas_sp.AAC.1